MNKTSTFSKRLNEILRLRNLRQTDLVAITQISKGAISKYLKGSVEPKAEALFVIANALHVSDKWLLGYDVPMEEPLIREHLEMLQFLTEDEAIRELAKILKANEFTAKFDYTDDELRDILRYCRFRGEEHEQAKS